MRCTYGPLAVFSAGGPGIPDDVVENATGGIFSAELNGPALPIYDFNDQPIPFITSSPTGQAQWRVDDQLVGWVRIGGISVRVMSNDAGDLLQNTAAAVAAAQEAAASAQQALEAIGASPGGGTGGGFTGSVDWVTQVANKPASFPPLIGTTAGTAAAGNDSRLLTTAQQAALANVPANTSSALAGKAGLVNGRLPLDQSPPGHTHSIALSLAQSFPNRAALTSRTDIRICVVGGRSPADWPGAGAWGFITNWDKWEIPAVPSA